MKKLFLIILMILLIPTMGYSGQWAKAIPLDADLKTDFPTDNQANLDATDRMLSNYRDGLKLSYSSATTISVSLGEVMVSNAAGTLRLMMNNTASTNVTFADIDTGAEDNATYYIYAIAATAASETATFKISLSSTTPDSVTYYKRLGSFINAAGDITETSITNDNDYYENLVMASGTVAQGGTIALPSGYTSEDNCKWIAAGLINATGSGSYGFDQMYYRISSGRVAECRSKDGESGAWRNGTCNYLIICNK